jgi:hypothetical protein
MKKVFLNAVLLVIIGNAIITILEKLLYSNFDMQALQVELINYSTNGALFAKVAPLLVIKIKIWVVAFSIVSAVLFFINPNNKKSIRNAVMLFYFVGLLVNLLIIPHPNWLYMALVPIVVVPFIVVDNVLYEAVKILKQISTNQNNSAPHQVKINNYNM